MIQGPLGKGSVVLALAPGLPWSLGSELLADPEYRVPRRREPLKAGERLVPGGTTCGTMALTAFDAQAAALSGWANAAEIAAFVADPVGNALRGVPRRDASSIWNATEGVPYRSETPAGVPDVAAATEMVSKPGETLNAALGYPFHPCSPASRTAPPLPSPGTFPTCSGSDIPAICTVGGGPTPRLWPAIWPRTSMPCGSKRSFTMPRSTSRTCPRSSSTPCPRRALFFAARPVSGRKTSTLPGSREVTAAAR